MSRSEILARIPHRPPFLWIDELVEQDGETIVTKALIDEGLDVFKGHYPDMPIMPGVLLCEAIFQSGALLLSYLIEQQDDETSRIPVLTRIEGAKFKRPVRPGDQVEIRVQLKETLSSVYYLRGTLKVGGKNAVQTDFACALADSTSI